MKCHNVSIHRIHSLYHSNRLLFRTMKLSKAYFHYMINKYRQVCVPYAKIPFEFNPFQDALWRLKRNYNIIKPFVDTPINEVGMPTHRIVEQIVPTLASICIAIILINRDMSAGYFLTKMKGCDITIDVYQAIAEMRECQNISKYEYKNGTFMK